MAIVILVTSTDLNLLVLPALAWKWEHFSANEGGMDVP